jgi:DNA-directed RNA polymerase specialized sigma24 family protein
MDQHELLEELRPWLKAVARRLTIDPVQRQDLAQEGWIAAWRTLDEQHPNPAALARTAAAWRMKDAFYRRQSFGSERERGRNGVVHPIPAALIETDFPPVWDDLDQVLEAYHHGEIMAAVNSLSERQQQRVIDRFWKGIYSDGRWWSEPVTGARAILREQLGHLRDAGI